MHKLCILYPCCIDLPEISQILREENLGELLYFDLAETCELISQLRKGIEVLHRIQK